MHKCWKLHGYPPNFKPNTWKRNTGQSSRANIAQGSLEEEEGELVIPTMTTNQHKHLMQMIQHSEFNNGD